MTTRSELKEILDWVRAEGGIVTRTRSGHYKVRHPKTGRSICLASTPGNGRTLRTAVARLRKIGFRRGTDRTTRRANALSG